MDELVTLELNPNNNENNNNNLLYTGTIKSTLHSFTSQRTQRSLYLLLSYE